jgi:asparagine synthetase B (glutamine-hydrolysing)
MDKFESDTEYLTSFISCYPTFKSITSQKALDEINSWDGFWSMLIINLQTKEAIVFTDPLGKKQMYYNSSGEFCSEIFPLRNNSGFDPIYFSQVSKWGYNCNERTPFAEVKRILPNCIYGFKINPDKIAVQSFVCYSQYYNWNGDARAFSVKEMLATSVSNRLISKTYKVSCLISGGLDSTIIAHHLLESSVDVKFFSVDNQDDTEYVHLLEREWGIDVQFLYIDDNTVMSKILRANETPIDLGSVIPQYKLFSIIANQDFHLCLSGDGADELFGGYNRINEYDSQGSDIFDELSYYHLPRLDRLSSRFTIELRCPYLSHNLIRYALQLPFDLRQGKKILKYSYANEIPTEIINRKKTALKSKQVLNDKIAWRYQLIEMFKEIIQ